MSNPKKFEFGKARSRKPIICFQCDEEEFFELILHYTKHYSDEDFFDAYCAFEYMVQYTLKKGSKFADELAMYEDNRRVVRGKLDDKYIEEEKSRLGLKTSIDVCLFGSTLVNPEFKNF